MFLKAKITQVKENIKDTVKDNIKGFNHEVSKSNN